MEKKKTNVILIILGVLIIGMIVMTILTFQYDVVIRISRLISLVFVALYGFWLYKIPHGNLLKYAMLLVGAADIFISAIYISVGGIPAPLIVKLFASTGVVYCAGRLDHIKQNKIILPIIDVVFLAIAIMSTLKFGSPLGIISNLRFYESFIMTTTLMMAYFLRYKEHKLAGMM